MPPRTLSGGGFLLGGWLVGDLGWVVFDNLGGTTSLLFALAEGGVGGALGVRSSGQGLVVSGQGFARGKEWREHGSVDGGYFRGGG